MAAAEHVSWCTGLHNTDYNSGDCTLVREWLDSSGETVSVRLLAIPYDSARLEIANLDLYVGADLDQLRQVLNELRPYLEAARAEADAEIPDEDDEDEPNLCDRCHQPNGETQLVRHHGYLCRTCVPAVGATWVDYGYDE